MPAASPTSWKCEFCGRTVPARIDKCYCGRTRSAAPIAAARSPATPRVSATRLSISVAVVTTLALTAWYYGARELADPIPPRPGAHARDESRPVIRASNSDPDAAVPPSDDIVQRALPAIVLVETSASRATGFYIAPDLIVTTRHAMGKDSSASIATPDGKQMNAVMVQSAYRQDVAVLRTQAAPLFTQALSLGRTNDVRNGDAVVRLSWPNTVTAGLVRSVRHHDQFLIDLVETSLVAQPGDEGAPLLNRFGKVVGVVTTTHVGTPGSGFAVGLN